MSESENTRPPGENLTLPLKIVMDQSSTDTESESPPQRRERTILDNVGDFSDITSVGDVSNTSESENENQISPVYRRRGRPRRQPNTAEVQPVPALITASSLIKSGTTTIIPVQPILQMAQNMNPQFTQVQAVGPRNGRNTGRVTRPHMHHRCLRYENPDRFPTLCPSGSHSAPRLP